MRTAPEANLAGLQVIPLRVIQDERGAVLHMIRSTAPHFSKFGEVYFSEVNPGVVKGWKRHRLMTQHFAVPVGRIKLVVFDDRPDSPTCGQIQTLHLGRPDAYQLTILPPMLWYGFQCTGETPAIMANCADLPYDPAESEMLPLDQATIPYGW